MVINYIILSVHIKKLQFFLHYNECFMAPTHSNSSAFAFAHFSGQTNTNSCAISMLLSISLGLRASTMCPNLCHFHTHIINRVHASESNYV